MAHETGLLTDTPFLAESKPDSVPGLPSRGTDLSGVLAFRLCVRLKLPDAREHAHSCGAVADFHRLPEHPNAFKVKCSSWRKTKRSCRTPTVAGILFISGPWHGVKASVASVIQMSDLLFSPLKRPRCCCWLAGFEDYRFG